MSVLANEQPGVTPLGSAVTDVKGAKLPKRPPPKSGRFIPLEVADVKGL